MLLTDARRPSRVAGGELVPLPEQDRGGWDRALIAEGHALVRECLAGPAAPVAGPGATSCWRRSTPSTPTRPSSADTDWRQIAALYDQLVARRPRAGRRAQPGRRGRRARRAGGRRWRRSTGCGLTGYHAWHATRADLLRRLGRSAEARAAYDAAIAATDNPAERAFLSRRRGQLSG